MSKIIVGDVLMGEIYGVGNDVKAQQFLLGRTRMLEF
jgi:hypothetical protein